MNLAQIIKTSSALGAAQALQAMGVSSGYISQNQARHTYGNWFLDAVASGRLKPAKVGVGKTGTKHFKVTDILALLLEDEANAELQ